MGSPRLGASVAAVVVMICAVAGIRPAEGQPGRPGWDTDVATVNESDGEVVVTLSFFRPGRVKYRTLDAMARAPEDYKAVSGEFVFSGGDSNTISIPIIDDDLAEASHEDVWGERYETFLVEAWEEPAPDPWPGGTKLTVRIIDNDEVATADDDGTGVTVTTSHPPAGPEVNGSSGTGELTAPPTTATSPGVELASELASDELRPGTGFELPLDEGSTSSTSNHDNRRGRATSRLAPLLGLTALGVGGVAWMQRRRRWSAHRA